MGGEEIKEGRDGGCHILNAKSLNIREYITKV
jgi:hypothetical protein